MEELRALNETFIGVAVVKKEGERQDIICFFFVRLLIAREISLFGCCVTCAFTLR